MAVYNQDGTQLEYVYNVQESIIDTAYDAYGQVVYESGVDPYAYYDINAIFSKSRNNAQGMDIYGNYMAVYDGSNYTIGIIDITSKTTVHTLSTSLKNHGNDVTFSKNFYDNNDPFPILYVEGKGLRLDLNNQTTIRVDDIKATPTGDTWVTYGTAFNDDMSKYYCMGYNTNNFSDPNGFIFLEIWDTSESIENPTRISSVIREWFPCIQGVAYHDGLLWVASGIDNPAVEPKVYTLDITDASIVKTVDLTRTGELEGIGWGYDESTDKWFCVYGQIYNGITYYRIDFSSKPIE